LPVERCDERDNDCDGELDEFLPLNRCGVRCGPEPVEVCNRFDDDCDGTLDEGLPVNACGRCGALPVEVCDDADNDCDGATDEGFARNLCGGCGPAPDEACNGADEDCDGRIDEGFDVGASVDHCAACGRSCSRAHAVPACLGGRCVLLACEDGWRDANLDPSDGCEAAAPQAVTLHVAEGADPEAADGSIERPYPTPAAALEIAEPNALVLVLPGAYAGPLTIDVEGVTVRSREPLAARLFTRRVEPPSQAVVTVSADHAALVGFEINGEGTVEGVRLGCAVGCAAVDNDVNVVPPVGLDVETTVAFGVRALGADGVTVRGNRVHHIHAGPSRFGGIGVVGVGIQDGSAAVVADNHIEQLIAGGAAQEGRPGGDVFGFRLLDADGARMTGNSIAFLTAGSGGTGPNANTLNGSSGWAVGIHVGASNDVVIDGAGVDDGGERLALVAIAGGGTLNKGALELPGRMNQPGPGIGVRLVGVNGVTVTGILVRRPAGGHSGFQRDVQRNPHRARGGAGMGFRLERVSDARFEGNEVRQPTGGPAQDDGPAGPAYGFWIDATSARVRIGPSNTVDDEPTFFMDGINGAAAVGLELSRGVQTTNLGKIVVRRSLDVRVVDNIVAGPSAAAGDTFVGSVIPVPGEPAYAIVLSEVRGASVVSGNRVSDVVGGAGVREGTTGGPAAGVRLDRCDGVQLSDNQIRRVRAGAAGPNAGRNRATGVWAAGGPVSSHNDLVAGIDGGTAAGFYLDAPLGELARATVYGVSGDVRGDGVSLANGAVQAIRVVDSIFAVISTASVHQREDQPPDPVSVSYCAIDRTEDPVNVGLGEGLLRVNAGFANEFAGDLSLGPNSPCIDAGDPNSDCGDEPLDADDTCAPDLGHLAGTGRARAR